MVNQLMGNGPPSLESESLYSERGGNATCTAPNQNDRKSFRAQK
jgi:hypothetical protein